MHDKYRHIMTIITIIILITVITIITIITIFVINTIITVIIIILSNSEVYAMGWHVTWGGRLLQRATRAT